MKFKVDRSAAATAAPAQIEPGRHIGTIVQIVNIGLMPAFNKDEPPQHHIGVAVEIEGGSIVARTISANTSVMALFGQLLDAAGLVTEGEEADIELAALLGKKLAVEIEVNGKGYSKITSFSPLEEWDGIPVPKSAQFMLDLCDTTKRGPDFNKHFQELAKDLRLAASRRIRA